MDMPFLTVYVFFYLLYIICLITIACGNQNGAKVLVDLFFPNYHGTDSESTLLSYVDRIMVLLIVDSVALVMKTYWAVLTLFAARFYPKKERYFFN